MCRLTVVAALCVVAALSAPAACLPGYSVANGSARESIHDGPARAARRRARQAAHGARSAAGRSLMEGEPTPPPPLTDEERLLAKLFALRRRLSSRGTAAAGTRRRMQGVAPRPLVKPPKPAQDGVVTAAAAAAKLLAAKPKSATKPPKFAELYNKKVSQTVSATLQKLAKVGGLVGRMRVGWAQGSRHCWVLGPGSGEREGGGSCRRTAR